MSTHFDPLVGWNAVSGLYWLTRDYILVVGAEDIVAERKYFVVVFAAQLDIAVKSILCQNPTV